ncbi:MAG: type 4 fimbrial biosis protein PilF-like protein [Ramlibacter sp.]|jgi:type IV pilus assembly protein PilF|uniref:type IV pilus biogenesis/stability protein PilW n=1 Tax=Ramlibacter sp. TaxID=1917967 RepID=UPI002631A7A2|nr:type IV pilus biogenesis/stability protein PilW [Ramlibacter sp.]MDB5749665.1 type 4 fimbrial biosis protein PilF-like protein [Ramlibacter sp.]
MTMAKAGTPRGSACVRAAAAGLLVALAGGCATPPQGQENTVTSVVTPSDETEARRRARIRLELAGGYFEQGQTDVALDELKQAIVADPTFADAYNLRGLIYMRLSDTRQAEDSFRRALALNSRDADTHHNFGWMQCQQRRFPEAQRSFDVALTNPTYGGRAKTLMAMGLCQARAGDLAQAERSLGRSYELDAGNPITGYNLSQLLFARGDFTRAQFYIRRLNNSELANAETLWLGIRVEQRMNDPVALEQLAEQLRKRYPQSRERASLDRRAFNE